MTTEVQVLVTMIITTPELPVDTLEQLLLSRIIYAILDDHLLDRYQIEVQIVGPDTPNRNRYRAV